MSLLKSTKRRAVVMFAILASVTLAFFSGVYPQASKASAAIDQDGVLSAQLEKGACYAGDQTKPAIVDVTYRGEKGAQADFYTGDYPVVFPQNQDLTITGQVQSGKVYLYQTGEVHIYLFDTGTPLVYPASKPVTVPKCGTSKPAQPTVSATSTEADYGKADGTATVTVTNTADDTNAAAIYSVTLNGVTKKTASVADGKSGSVTFTGLAADTYPVSVAGNDGTSATTSVTVKEGAPPVVKPTVNLTASDTSLTVGQSTTLSWTSKNAVSLMASGAWSGSKTVPSGSQVVTPSAAGTYVYKLAAKSSGGDTASDSVTVTVKAPAPTHVTATPPSFTDKCGVDNDVYTIPSEKGVVYYVNDAVKAAGTYSGSGSVTVTAKAADGYVLDGNSSWSHTFSTEPCVTPPTHVTAKAPSVKADKCGVDDDTYSIPSVKGVDYYVNGEVVSAGSHSTKGALKVVVTAKAQKGYVLDGDSSWTLNFTDEPCTTPPTKVTAMAPTSVDECSTANDTYTIPSTEGVQYYVDGNAISAGTYSTDDALKVKVTAKAKDGYVLEGKSSWTLKFTDEPCTTPPPAQSPSIEAKASCGQVTFTNPNGFAVEVWYGNKSGSKVDGDIVVPANGSKVVKTSRTTLYYVIGKDGQAADKVYSVKVKQDCNTAPPTSPTTEPTSPSSSPTSPSTSPSSSPSSTSTGTPTSTGTNPPTATSTSSSSSTGGASTTTTTSGVTGPTVVTDGNYTQKTRPNLWGIGGIFSVLGIGAIVLWRRFSNATPHKH